MPRAPKRPLIYSEKINTPKELARFATPEEAAVYRAERLKCDRLAEIGSGIAAQTMAFSLVCKKVLGIEIDPISLRIAKNNLKKAGAKNTEVIEGDALDENLIQKVEEFRPEIIFCDTQRPEKSKRTLSEIKPDIFSLLEKYSRITDKIAIEIPPYTDDIERLSRKFPLEKEFISINGKLNRLTLYFNSLRTCEVSIVEVRTKEKISGTPKKSKDKNCEFSDAPKIGMYLGIINPAVALSGMTSNLCEKLDSKIIPLDGKDYFISDSPKKTSFIEYYEILGISEAKEESVSKELGRLNAKDAVIRYRISPGSYWKERKNLERGLNGSRTVHIFNYQGKKIFCERWANTAN